MSTESQVVNHDQAYNEAMQNIHYPVFFARLREHNINPENEKQAQQLLDIGNKLHDELEKVGGVDAIPTPQGDFLDKVAGELTGKPAAQAGLAEISDDVIKQAVAGSVNQGNNLNNLLSLAFHAQQESAA